MLAEITSRIDQIRHGIVPEGYCKTPLDITPEEWTHTTISKICKLSSGSTPRRDKSDNFIGDILWVSSGELKCRVLSDTLEHISENAADASHLKMYSPGTVVIAIYGLEAEGVRGTASILGTKCTISQACMAFTDFQNVNNEYLYYWYLFHGNVIGLRYAQGTKQQNLSSDIIDALPISLPDIDTQVRIAAILTTQDKVIALKEQLLAQKLEQKKYLMQQLLTGKKRLLGFDGEWQYYRIGEIGSFYSGLSGKTKDDFGCGNARYIPFKNVLTNTVIDSDNLESVVVTSTETQNAVSKNDLFFNLSSETAEEVGMAAVLLTDLENTYLNSFCIGYRVHNPQVFPHYLAYYFASPVGRKMMATLAQGVTRINLNKAALVKLMIRIPEAQEQMAIINVLSTADKELDLLRQSIEQEKQKKKALMQLLLTGIVRV